MTAVMREQQRQAGGDERAERDEQDDQRDRQRQGLGALEVVVEGLRDRLVRAGAAELLDAQLGVRALRGGGGRASDASTRSLAASSSPGILNDTSAERPSLETWPALPRADSGDSTSVDVRRVARRRRVDVARPLPRSAGRDGSQRALALDEDLLAGGLAGSRRRRSPRRRCATGRCRTPSPSSCALSDRAADDGREDDERGSIRGSPCGGAGRSSARSCGEIAFHRGLLSVARYAA